MMAGIIASDEPASVLEFSESLEPASEVTVPTLRVLMIAGATGGHIFPVLAVARELAARSNSEAAPPHASADAGLPRSDRSPGKRGAAGAPPAPSRPNPAASVVFLGTRRGLESRLIPAAGFELRTVQAAGLKGIGGFRRLANLMVLPRSAIETARVLKSVRPDVVAGIGGYLAGPAILEAAMMNIPTLLIEPNAVPGFTNRVLGPIVRGAAVGFEDAARFYGAKARYTGHPVREAFFAIRPKRHLAPFTLLIVGGSQGARAVNQCAPTAMALLARKGVAIRVVHQTGERDYNEVSESYRGRGIQAEVRAFIDDMPEAFSHADVIVSRAGATAVAELSAAGKASVLIPFPGATDQHQLENARAMQRAGAARLVEQRELTPERLAEELEDLLRSEDRLLQMELCAAALAKPDAARRIADWILELGRRNSSV